MNYHVSCLSLPGKFQTSAFVKITLLGTGTSQGVPMIGCDCNVCLSKNKKDKRLRSSVLIEHDGTSIVIDTGPDFRYQMLRAGVKDLDAVLLTHEHYDHVAGLDDIRAFNRIRRQPMDVYAEKRVLTRVEHELDYAFGDRKLPGLPSIRLNEINEFENFRVGSIDLIPLRTMHHKLPVLGFRTGDFAYITDTNYIPQETLKKLTGVKVLVLTALRLTPHISHFNLEQAVEAMQKINPERGFFTHMSHQIGLHEEVNKTLPAGMELGYDGLEIFL